MTSDEPAPPGRRAAHESGAGVTGTPGDPHAQARAARAQPLLLHSMSLFRELFETIFRCRDIGTVVEIGVESGQVSSLYADLGATVHCVEPAPGDELRAVLADDPRLHLVEGRSPEVLGELPVADLYVLDGDHNYAVVRAELAWIMKNAPGAVVVLNDVLWPCGRRDCYYQPSPLPSEDRHPETQDGPTVWHDDVTPAGFVGNGAFTFAAHAGGERNGVLTAVEDALALDEAPPDEERPDGLEGAGGGWRLAIVPAVFGFGVLARDDAPGAEEIFEALRPFTSSRLLAAMENNRIALYTRVLQLQYEITARQNDAGRLAETVSAQQREIADLRSELQRSRAENVAARQEVERLRAGAGQPSPADPELSEAVSELGRALSARIRGRSGPPR